VKQEILRLIDILGTIAFAISGVFAAMEKKLDLFGILIIAFVTAIGGGTVRDLLIGDLPVSWIRTIDYAIIIFIAALTAVLFNKVIRNFETTLLIFDSLGLGFFTLLGIQKGIAFNLEPAICIMLGTVTGCFGGVIRDTVLQNIPIIFRKEVYATACIVGGCFYFLLRNTGLNKELLEVFTLVLIFAIRLVAVRFHLQLPSIYKKEK
jgi:uncharacterized membrane protein YeiH